MAEQTLKKSETINIMKTSLTNGLLAPMLFGESGIGKTNIILSEVAKSLNLKLQVVSVANLTLVDAFGRESNPVPNTKIFPIENGELINSAIKEGFKGILFVLDDVLKQIDPELQKGVVNPLLYEKVIRNLPLDNRVKIVSTANLDKGQDSFRMDIAQATRNCYVPFAGDNSVVAYLAQKGLFPNEAVKRVFSKHTVEKINSSNAIEESWGKITKIVKGNPSNFRQWEDLLSKLPHLLQSFFKKDLSEFALMEAIKGSLGGLGNKLDVETINSIISEYKQAEKLVEYKDLVKMTPNQINKKNWSTVERLSVARVYLDLMVSEPENLSKKKEIKAFLLSPSNEATKASSLLTAINLLSNFSQKKFDSLMSFFEIDTNQDVRYSQKGYDKKWYDNLSDSERYDFDELSSSIFMKLGVKAQIS